MGLKNKISTGHIYFLTMTVVNWIDVFTRPVYKNILIDSLKYNQENKGLVLYSWCLMTNHLHLIAEADEKTNLSGILRDFKKFTSKAIVNEIIENPHESRKHWMLDEFEFVGRNNPKIKNYKFWQDGNEAKEIVRVEFLEQKLNYIHQNPVKSEVVNNAEDYRYSSAIDYAGGKGLLDIILV
ncbi:MAG: transposase [Chlorobi bacterium]|nr:transposase [Chlorobiota bacterium]